MQRTATCINLPSCLPQTLNAAAIQHQLKGGGGGGGGGEHQQGELQPAAMVMLAFMSAAHILQVLDCI